MKKRVIIFTVLSIVSAVFTIIFAASLCELASINTNFADEVGDINIDGSDFTPVFELGASMLDVFMTAIIPLIFAFFYFVAVSLLNLATFGFYRAFGLRNVFDADAEELRITRKVYGIFSVGATAVTVIISICGVAFFKATGVCFFGLLLCWQYPLFAWLFCLRRLKTLGAPVR